MHKILNLPPNILGVLLGKLGDQLKGLGQGKRLLKNTPNNGC
jgi:hypothetical protein